ncbi:MAG: glycosyltransferase [Clostridia bacterium]|nr:glycosyltransferase [Clostridia bacterium]
MVVVVIPAYKPDKELIKLTEKLSTHDLGILVVNDGSGKEFDGVFKSVEPFAKVIHLEKNGGKGGALKAGFKALAEQFPEHTHFITADADGQHSVEDILRVRDALLSNAEMVLTVRGLNKKIPFRSKIGNDLSRRIFTLLTGHWLADNQSGLRGFSAKHTEWLLKVGGEKYDYEMNVLYYAKKQKIEITTLPIKAIYIDGNSSSHFNPIKDTVRIYKRLFSSASAGLISWIFCEIALIVIWRLYDYQNVLITVPSVGITGALIRFSIDQFILFNGIALQSASITFLSTVTRYVLYAVGCFAFNKSPLDMPMILTVNLIAFAIIPFKYLICKYIGKAKHKKYAEEEILRLKAQE